MCHGTCMMIWQKWSCSRPHGGRRIQHSFRMHANAYTSTCDGTADRVLARLFIQNLPNKTKTHAFLKYPKTLRKIVSRVYRAKSRSNHARAAGSTVNEFLKSRCTIYEQMAFGSVS